jgi:hypothetical protein
MWAPRCEREREREREREGGPGGLTREVETPLPSNSPQRHQLPKRSSTVRSSSRTPGGFISRQVLSFLVDDWVNVHEPDVVFLETIVNDGDTVLETGDETGVRRAVEGIQVASRTLAPQKLKGSISL